MQVEFIDAGTTVLEVEIRSEYNHLKLYVTPFTEDHETVFWRYSILDFFGYRISKDDGFIYKQDALIAGMAECIKIIEDDEYKEFSYSDIEVIEDGS